MDGRVDSSGQDNSDYDEEQRAEILEAEGRHPVKDGIETDLLPDKGGSIDGPSATDEELSQRNKP